MAEPKLSIKQMKESRAAWASPAAVLDAVLGEGPLALAEIPAKLPWRVEA